MPYYVGLDASKYATSICVINEEGTIVREGSVATEPKDIIGFLRGDGRRYRLVGIEAMSLAPWLYENLARAGLPVVCIDARRAHAILKERLNKTDRNDAKGIAEIMRARLYRAVHVKTASSQHAKLLLASRRLLSDKRMDVDSHVRGLLLQFGLKLAAGQPTTFESRARRLVDKTPALREAIEAMLAVRAVIVTQLARLGDDVRALANGDPVCRRLMTAPGVGAITALSYRCAIDLPARFGQSRQVGVHLGLTPRTYQSGTVERRGRISRCGDFWVRRTLFLSAMSVLKRGTRACALKSWGQSIVERRGYLKAVIAVARRLAVILHRMWVSETDFCWEQPA